MIMEERSGLYKYCTTERIAGLACTFSAAPYNYILRIYSTYSRRTR
jgi:hypothetical protein